MNNTSLILIIILSLILITFGMVSLTGRTTVAIGGDYLAYIEDIPEDHAILFAFDALLLLAIVFLLYLKIRYKE